MSLKLSRLIEDDKSAQRAYSHPGDNSSSVTNYNHRIAPAIMRSFISILSIYYGKASCHTHTHTPSGGAVHLALCSSLASNEKHMLLFLVHTTTTSTKTRLQADAIPNKIVRNQLARFHSVSKWSRSTLHWKASNLGTYKSLTRPFLGKLTRNVDTCPNKYRIVATSRRTTNLTVETL